jgi:hypothetical protein
MSKLRSKLDLTAIVISSSLVGLPNITIRAVKVANHQLTTANLPFNHQISRHLNYHPRRPKICLKQPKRPLQKS